MQMTTTERCHFLIRVVIRCINVSLSTQQEITDVDKDVKIRETLDTAGRHVKCFFSRMDNSLTVFQNTIHRITI